MTASPALAVIGCLALIAILILGRGRWYRYTQAATLAALCGWLIGRGAGLALALAGVSVVLFLVEGWAQSRPLSPPRLTATRQRYREKLLEMRATIRIVSRDDRPESRMPYFQLCCMDRVGQISPSALNELLRWATLQKAGFMALYGGFGTGKSTTCLEFCLTLLEHDTDSLPIYLPLNRVTHEVDASLWLSEVIGKHYGLLNHPGDPMFALTQDDRVCLVFDGLESVEEYFAHPVIRFLLDNSPTKECPRAILAARRLTADLPVSEQARALSSDRRVSAWLGLIPMDSEAQRKYAATVHGAHLGALEDEDPPIVSRFDILDRPFLIDLAYCATRSDTPLGSSLAVLYAAATDSVLAEDARDKPLAPPSANTNTILRSFALEAYRLGEEQLPLDIAVQYIAARAGLPRNEITEALNSCRLLTDYGGRIGFAHRSLEEFFVAAACIEGIRLGEWGTLHDFLLVEPVLGFLLDLLAIAPDRDELGKLISNRFTYVATARVQSNGHTTANLASLMSGLNLSMCEAELNRISLSGATMSNADLRKAVLQDVDLSGVDLSGADLTDALLERVDFRNAFIRAIDCQGTELIDCRFWNLRWIEEPPSLWSARWHPRERAIVCGLSTGHIILAALTAKGELGEINTCALGSTGVLDVDTENSGAVVLASDRAGRVVELASSSDGKSLHEVTADDTTHAANVRRIRFAPHGPTWYATASRDGFVRLFVRGTSIPYRQHGRHRAPVMDLAWHPRASLLASAGYDGRVFVWDLTVDYAQPLATPTSGAPGIMRAVAFSPSGQRMVVAGEIGTVTEWQVNSDGSAFSPTVIRQPGPAIFAVAYLTETAVLAGTWNGEVLLIRDGEVECVWKHQDAVRSIDIAHDYVMTASWDGGIAIATRTPELVSGPHVLPFPDALDEPESNFVGARMVRPTSLSTRYIQRFAHLGVDIQQ